MPASTRPSPSEPRRPQRPGATAAHGEAAVSEVVGFLLVFAILSMVLVASLYAFGKAREATEERVVALHADSIAHRVASVVVEASLFAETTGTDATYTVTIELPQALEGRGYEIALQPAAPGSVVVRVPSLGITEEAPLFEAGAPAGFCVDDSDIAGGPAQVRYGADADNPGTYCIFLEALP